MRITVNDLLLVLIIIQGTMAGCREVPGKSRGKEIAILENEKWWGGAVLDGRNSPLNNNKFVYDQYANCKTNQAAPLFLSSKGRYIWSEKPLKVEMSDGRIVVESHGGEVFYGKAGENLREAYMYASKHFSRLQARRPIL